MQLRAFTTCLILVVFGAAACPGRSGSESGAVAVADERQGPGTHAFSSETVLPHSALGLDSGLYTGDGRPARIMCRTCHEELEVKPEQQWAEALTGFHASVVVEHGGQTCRGCHNAPLFQDFRLQDGRTVDYPDVMRLCAQCHGLQARDYERGLHGGMTGYWDLDSGPRLRNHCLHCHDAHKPALPMVLPAPLPASRFQEGPHDSPEVHDG